MTLSTSSPRKRSRWTFLTIAVGIITVLTTAVASANLAGSTFEGGDGNLVVNTAGNKDWANVSGRSAGVDKASGSTDNAFGQGTKEDDPNVTVVTGSIPPNKNDLTRFYEASEQGANGHIYLYLAWERLVNIGNANLDFEISKNATSGFNTNTTGPLTLNRTAGDLLVTYDFGGSGTPTLGLLKWVTSGATSQCFSANALPCWGNRVNLSAAGEAEGAVNSGTIAEPIAGGNLGTGLFGEAAIDLTAAGVFQPGVCQAFGSTFVKSRSSSSFTAEIKDFIAPVPVSISNCGSITINKVTENGNSTFGFTTSGSGLSSFSLANGGSKPFSPLNAGSYSVTENLTAAQTTAGWTLKSISCTSSGSGTSTSTSGSTVNITLGLGGNVSCTYTNHINFSPSITTQVVNTNGAATDTDIPNNGHVGIPTTAYDTATLSGATSDAGGTVTYYVEKGDATCSTEGATSLGAKTVTNGSVPNSNTTTLSSAGTYYFWAVYSGDANNVGTTSGCNTEIVVVDQNSSQISTAQSLIPNDSATLSGVTGTAGGTITFKLFSPSDATCAGTPEYSQTVTVDVAANGLTYSTTNSSFVASAEGTWRWLVSYSGDADNSGSTSACGVENFVIDNS